LRGDNEASYEVENHSPKATGGKRASFRQIAKYDPLVVCFITQNPSLDEPVKSQKSDGFVKSSQTRHANPEE
jgi:hypothetical protein